MFVQIIGNIGGEITKNLILNNLPEIISGSIAELLKSPLGQHAISQCAGAVIEKGIEEGERLLEKE